MAAPVTDLDKAASGYRFRDDAHFQQLRSFLVDSADHSGRGISDFPHRSEIYQVLRAGRPFHG